MRSTIVFQPQNHVGLGHINRLSAIALALRGINPSVRTPFIVEGAGSLLLDALSLPYIALPSSHAMNETPAWDAWHREERWHISMGTSRAIVAALNPDIVVFDCFPNEAFAAVVKEQKVPIVLCFREVKSPALYLKRLEGLLPRISRILIPHDKGTFLLPDELMDKSCFVGEIVRPRAPTNAKDRDVKCPSIVISGGGGGYPGTVHFFNTAIQAVACLQKRNPTSHVRLITGPLFSDWDRLELTQNLSVIPFDPELPNSWNSADLVICQAGYNTIAEIQHVQTRVIVIPGQRRWDDQFVRAERAAEANRNFRVFREQSPSQLAEMAADFLREPLAPIQTAEPEGATRAAECLCRLLFDNRTI